MSDVAHDHASALAEATARQVRFRTRVGAAAVAWLDARGRACAAPMGDGAVWRELADAEDALGAAVRAMKAHEAAAAEKAVRPIVFVVHGWMNWSPHTEEHCTLEEAVASAKVGCDEGCWAPDDVRTPTGEIVLDHPALSRALDEGLPA